MIVSFLSSWDHWLFTSEITESEWFLIKKFCRFMSPISYSFPTGLEKHTPEIHPKYDRISDRKCSKKYKLLIPNHEITMKIYGVRLEARIFWNIFGPKYDRILGEFRVYFFWVRLGCFLFCGKNEMIKFWNLLLN
jgi:hypothetical protein